MRIVNNIYVPLSKRDETEKKVYNKKDIDEVQCLR